MRKDLAAGHIEDARNNLERASTNFHSVEIELGLIQTLMQAGEYTHALSAAAHTQAEHSDNSDAIIFYAWLLAIGGHEQAARELTEKHPQDDALKHLCAQIKNHQLNAAAIKTSDAIQLAPFSKYVWPSQQVLQSGVLLPDGIHAITTHLNFSAAANPLKIRNGLGELAEAKLNTDFNSDKLSLLTLDHPLKINLPIKMSANLIPGRPVYLIGYNPHNRKQASWPQLKMDVVGMPDRNSPAFKIHVQGTQPGSGLYNQAGQLVALAGDENLVIGLSEALEFLAINTATNATPQTMDDIYQTALASSLQILEDSSPD